jgi:hypothetical protein
MPSKYIYSFTQKIIFSLIIVHIIIIEIIFFVNSLLYNSYKKIGQVAHNVPAVYNILAARIRALRSKNQGGQNVAEAGAGMERSGMI